MSVWPTSSDIYLRRKRRKDEIQEDKNLHHRAISDSLQARRGIIKFRTLIAEITVYNKFGYIGWFKDGKSISPVDRTPSNESRSSYGGDGPQQPQQRKEDRKGSESHSSGGGSHSDGRPRSRSAMQASPRPGSRSVLGAALCVFVFVCMCVCLYVCVCVCVCVCLFVSLFVRLFVC